MPTLRQLNIHPQTQERLSEGGGGGINKRKRSLSELNDPNETVTSTQPRPPSFIATAKSSSSASLSTSSFAPIKTPSALLSRDPTQLSSALGASIKNIKKIRSHVSSGIISDPYVGHGGYADEIVAGVTKYCIVYDDESVSNEQHNDVEGVVRRKITHPKALIAGAVTALDLCARQLLLKNMCSQQTNGNGQYLDCIRTGSTSIDQLLAPDITYSTFDNGWSMPYPYKIPINNDESASSFDHSTTKLPPGLGVPFGMVTEFTGPPSSGKTQLVLSIAAHAALENKMQIHYISGGNSRRASSRRLFTMFLELARSSVLEAAAFQQQYQRNHNGGGGGGMTHQMEEEAKSVALKALDRVNVASVPDAYSLLALLTRIDNEETSIRRGGNNVNANNKSEDSCGGTLLVLDSVSGCLGHHLSSDTGAALANQVALTLRQLARTHDGHILGSSSQMASDNTIQPRRFAVVVTNGSVAKFSMDKESVVGSSSTTGKKQTQNKPAMGRYWHVSDVGIWLEEDKSSSQDARSQQQPINFYEDTPVVGLSLAEKKVVCATLQNHYGKSCKGSSEQHVAKFRIRGGGIDDL